MSQCSPTPRSFLTSPPNINLSGTHIEPSASLIDHQLGAIATVAELGQWQIAGPRFQWTERIHLQAADNPAPWPLQLRSERAQHMRLSGM